TATVTNIALPIVNKRRVFYPSQLPNVNKRFVSYILNDSINGFSSSTPQNSYYQLRLLDLDNPANDYLIEQQPSIYPATVPMDVIVPRWIKGSPYLTFGYRDSNNKVQAKEFNAYNPLIQAVPATNDFSNKTDGYPVLNPITNEQYFLSGINTSDTAYFYKRNSFGSIFTLNEIVVPQSVNLHSPALNQSHEPFLFNGKLYSTFQINNSGGNFFETTFNQPGEIWMTTVDSAPQTMWLLSEYDSTLNVSEPEPYVGNNKVWVYYSAVKIDTTKPYLKRQFQLRRCETPLNLSSVTDGQVTTSFIHLYPNPFRDYLIIEVPNLTSDFEITVCNVLGEKITTVKNITYLDLSSLSDGIYFVHLNLNNRILTEKIIKLK
ncbi:MAG: T9SS type A sorting domain-containing protein, partial [Bacteroidales bacterium]